MKTHIGIFIAVVCLFLGVYVFVVYTAKTGKIDDNFTVETGDSETNILKDIAFVSISSDTFRMGDVEGEGRSNEKPVHTVTVSPFEISVYEITNAQYAVYLNTALLSGDINEPSGGSVKGKTGEYSDNEYIYLAGNSTTNPNNDCYIIYSNGSFSVRTGYENCPVTWVTWYGAKAFALYYDLDLPREAEWEYACRGGRHYKYGTDDGTISSSKLNYRESGIKHPIAVGSYPNNPFGLYDMSGNVWEWCDDWYGDYTSVSVKDPTGSESGSTRVVRGGGWDGNVLICRSAYRFSYHPAVRSGTRGFRVVRRQPN